MRLLSVLNIIVTVAAVGWATKVSLEEKWRADALANRVAALERIKLEEHSTADVAMGFVGLKQRLETVEKNHATFREFIGRAGLSRIESLFDLDQKRILDFAELSVRVRKMEERERETIRLQAEGFVRGVFRAAGEGGKKKGAPVPERLQ